MIEATESMEVLPTFDFSNVYESNSNDNSFDSSQPEFDVYTAARNQSRTRNSTTGLKTTASTTMNPNNTFDTMDIENDMNGGPLLDIDENVAKDTNVSTIRVPKFRDAKKQTVYKSSGHHIKSRVLRSVSVSNISTSRNGNVNTTTTTAAGIRNKSNTIIKVKSAMKSAVILLPSSKKSSILSSQDLELKQIEQEKKSQQEKMENTKKTYQQLKRRGSVVTTTVIRSTKELTIPKTPIHKLTNRLGKRSYSIVKGMDDIHVSQPNTVATEPSSSSSVLPLGLTEVKPFTFETEKRAKNRGIDHNTILGSVCPIIPAAEIELSFMRDARSHDVPMNAAKRLTEPKTPTLLTKQRAESDNRLINLKSHEEMEREEMENFQKNPFKAKPVDKRIFESTEALGIPKVSPRPLTEPHPFSLRIDKRSSSRNSFMQSSSSSSSSAAITEEVYNFKALPLPQFSPRPISPRAPESTIPLTIPVSPKLHGKDRASSAPSHRQKPHHSEVERQRALELEAYKQSFKNSNNNNCYQVKVTQPQEFHFRTSERIRVNKYSQEEMIRQQDEIDRQNREIHARPAPKFHPINTKPITIKREVTEIKEFTLRSTARHEAAKSSFQKQVEEKVLEESTIKPFRARRVPKSVLHSTSFSN